jgi:hypothetical protein
MGKAPPSRRSSTAARVPEAGCRSAWARGVWLPGGILLVGAVLRIVYAAGSDVRNVYDDHFQVARIMLDERRWPHPDDNWEAYQPPLYHALSALTY